MSYAQNFVESGITIEHLIGAAAFHLRLIEKHQLSFGDIATVLHCFDGSKVVQINNAPLEKCIACEG